MLKKIMDKLFNNRQKLLFTISYRNLVRQRRRNILLGLAIAIGMLVLVMTNSWAHGITDLLLNKVMVYAFGHVQVTQTEKGRFQQDIIRDAPRIKDAILRNVKGIDKINETCSAFTRIIGNGKADMVAIVGIDPERFKKEGFGGFTAIEGDIGQFTNSKIENPIYIYEDKAKDLNIHTGDFVKAKLTTIYGQQQSAKFQVVAVLKSIGFMQSMAAFTPLGNIKSLLGYQPWESGAIQIVLKKPQSAIQQADKIHKALTPGYAIIDGSLSTVPGNRTDVEVLSYYKKTDIIDQVVSPVKSVFEKKAEAARANAVEKQKVQMKKFAGRDSKKGKMAVSADTQVRTNRTPLEVLSRELKTISGSLSANSNEKMLAVSSDVAKRLDVHPGSHVILTYADKFGNRQAKLDYRISCVYEDAGKLPGGSALLHERNFNETWFQDLPASSGSAKRVVATNSALSRVLMKEWLLMHRSSSMDEMQKKFKMVTKAKWKSGVMDVSSMYETFDVIVKMESTITLITGIMVMILFFVILVGVVNTLNMTIRERTREIGTVRAVGMQSPDVRDTFLLEVLMLAVAACLAGIIGGFILMGLLSLFPIHTTGMFSMFLDQGHLHFVPLFGNIGTILWLLVLFLMIYWFINDFGPRVRPVLMGLLFLCVSVASVMLRIVIVKLSAGVGWMSAVMGAMTGVGSIVSLLLMVYALSYLFFMVRKLFRLKSPGRRDYFFNLTLIALSIVFVYFGSSNGEIIPSMLVIVLLGLVTAFFPSRKASNMSAASALRHYE